MKYVFYVLLPAFVLLSICSSCGSSDDKLKYVELKGNLDLGQGTYRPNPFKFLDNIIPFSWMGMPDSVKKQTEFEISFNEDAMRSQSVARIAFVDSNGNKIEGITFGKSGDTDFTIKADTAHVIVPISFTVNPNIGDGILNGSIVILGTDLEKVNETTLGSTLTPVATFTLEHETGINWLRWIILILIVVVIVCLIAMIIYCLYHGIVLAALKLSSFTRPSIRSNNSVKNKTVKDSKKEQDKKKKENNSILKKLLKLEQKLYGYLGVADKYDILEQMRFILDDLYENDINTYVAAKGRLKANTWDALEEAWTLWNPSPTSNVEWGGIKQRVCMLKLTHPLYDECRNKYKFIKCSYDEHGSPDFSNVTFPNSVVDISDLYDKLSSEEIKKRGGSADSLQEIAQEQMYIKLKPTVEKWAKENNRKPDDFYAWRNAHNLVPHEDTNCRTMRLVYRPPHEAFKHRGGVANAQNIKNHFP